jgi:hypothetical protein
MFSLQVCVFKNLILLATIFPLDDNNFKYQGDRPVFNICPILLLSNKPRLSVVL